MAPDPSPDAKSERPPAASPAPGLEKSSAGFYHLAECLREIVRGDGTFQLLLLRQTDISEACIDHGDVDVLASRESVGRLIDFVYDLAQAGFCNFRVVANKPEKVRLSLYSSDARHRIDFDLWIDLWQVDGGRRCLRFEDCAPLLEDRAGITRLPVELEACVYVHHLDCKRKDIRSESVQSRLTWYLGALSAAGHLDLATELAITRSEGRVRRTLLAETLFRLADRMDLPRQRQTTATRLLEKLRSLWLRASRRPRVVALMGCDGVGKTSLCNRLVEQPGQARVSGTYVGKKLYRRSLLYRLTVGLVRPLTRLSRERIDEGLSVPLYVRASLRLRLMVLLRAIFRRRGLLIVDRSLADFLFVRRKTDDPTFCRFHEISEVMGQRVPVVHLVVDFDTLNTRKQEITRPGHAVYNEAMRRLHTRRSPTDYTVFNNGRDLDESAAALSRLLTAIDPKSRAA